MMSFCIPETITGTGNIVNNGWCGGSSHKRYTYITGVGYCEDGDTTKVLGSSQANSEEIIRRYLSGAYYKVTSNITIKYNSGFEGLGKTPNVDGRYYDAVFHGVISGDNYVITNETQYRLYMLQEDALSKT